MNKPTYIDLTMDVNEKLPIYPGDSAPVVRQVLTDGIHQTELVFHSHTGTHIDAPFHMKKNGTKLKDYSLETFIGEAIILNCVGQKELTADVSEVKRGDIVLLRTDYSKKAYQTDYFSNNPFVSEELAKALVEKHINILGIDSFSPDNLPYKVHKILFDCDILSLENLVNLDKISKKRFKLCVFPLKLESDGAPCRVVAEI